MTDLQSEKERSKIYDRASLLNWLSLLPPDRRREVAAVVAARAALRVLPLIVRSTYGLREQPVSEFVFSIFFATAMAHVGARYWHRVRIVSAADVAREAAIANTPKSATRATLAAISSAVSASLAHINPNVVAEAVESASDAVAYGTAASDDIWYSTSSDITVLDSGVSPSALASEPIWREGIPKWATEHWTRLRDELTELHWAPWLDWYQRRLDGRDLSEEIELLFAALSVDPGKKNPAEQNALLAQEIVWLTSRQKPRERPQIPERKPAAIEPISEHGKILLRKKPASADLDARALNAALRALKRQLADLVESLDAETNIDKRAAASLRRLTNLIPTKRPTQEQLFRLAHEQEKLEAYATSVVEEWPRMLAADYLAATRAFDRTVRQFPSWRQFKANAEKDRLTAEQREATPRIAAEFAEALREDEAAQFVEQEIAAIVSEMASRLAAQSEAQAQRFDPIAAGADLLAEDIITSIENVLKAIAEAAISVKRRTTKLASRAGKSIDKELDRLADGVGPALTKWAGRALIGYAGVKTGAIALIIQKLMHQFPQIEEWLRPVLDFLS